MEDPESKGPVAETSGVLGSNKKCRLAFTAKDHKDFGSNPSSDELINNPQKREVDLMTDGDIKELLELQKAELTRLQKKALTAPNFDATREGIRYRKAAEENVRALKFLKEIKRLPKDLRLIKKDC